MASKEKRKTAGQAVKKSERKSNGARWSWLFTGLAIGLFVAFLVWLQSNVPMSSDPLTQEREQDKTKAEDTTAGADEDKRFEFYTLLPEMEVLIPQTGEKPPATRQEDVTKPGNYALQAGSFRRFGDADRRKASLALLGIESQIQKVEVAAGETWHRVRIGPYEDLDELNKVRRQLQENNIETLLIRIKG